MSKQITFESDSKAWRKWAKRHGLKIKIKELPLVPSLEELEAYRRASANFTPEPNHKPSPFWPVGFHLLPFRDQVKRLREGDIRAYSTPEFIEWAKVNREKFTSGTADAFLKEPYPTFVSEPDKARPGDDYEMLATRIDALEAKVADHTSWSSELAQRVTSAHRLLDAYCGRIMALETASGDMMGRIIALELRGPNAKEKKGEANAKNKPRGASSGAGARQREP